MVADPRLPGAQLLLVARISEREHRLGVLDPLEMLQRRRADPLGGRVGRAQLGFLAPRSPAARRAAGRRRRRRSPGRPRRSRGGCGAPAPAAARRRACSGSLALTAPRPRRSAEAEVKHRLEVALAQAADPAMVGEVEMHRRDRDPPVRDRREVGALLVLEGGLEAVDLVAPAPGALIAVDQLQLVVVEALSEVGDLHPVGLPGRAVDVDQRALGHRLVRSACAPAAP